MKYFYLLFAVMLLSGCELKENPIFRQSKNTDSIIIDMDSVQQMPEFTLSTFSEFPEEIDGCSCYFSLTKNAFKNRQYIFSGMLMDSVAYVKKEGDWVKMMQKIPSDSKSDSIFIEALNDSLNIQIHGVQDSASYETRQYKGDINIFNFGTEVFSGEVYGECGC